MIGHGRGGAVAVDHHIGDIVDEAGAALGDRVTLAGKDIGLATLLGAARVGAEVGEILTLQRVVLADRGPSDPLSSVSPSPGTD